MTKAFATITAAWVAASAFGFSAYEPFADASGSGGTRYEAGLPVYYQTNAQGLTWFPLGTSGNQLTISAENLTVPGLMPSIGGSLAIGGRGVSARFSAGNRITRGTAYFSFAVKLTDVSGATRSGIFFAGLNNSAGEQAAVPTTISTRVLVKPSGDGFQVGLDHDSGRSTNFVFDPATYKTGETLFIVGAYTINPGPSNDVSRLWVNPNAATFGATNAPDGALVAGGSGADITVNSLLILNRATQVPPGSTPYGLVDEVRVGTSWAAVTPPARDMPVATASPAAIAPPATKSHTTISPVGTNASSPISASIQSPVTVAVQTGSSSASWLIAGALGVIILLLFGVFLMLRRQGDNSSMAVVLAGKTSPTFGPSEVAVAPPAEAWRERALSAEAQVAKQSQILDTKVGPELIEFAKQALVQGLYTQRQALIETQRRAQAALKELETHLDDLRLPLQERVRAYENRIAELEKQLDDRGNEMRELTRATLLLMREKLDQEKSGPGPRLN